MNLKQVAAKKSLTKSTVPLAEASAPVNRARRKHNPKRMTQGAVRINSETGLTAQEDRFAGCVAVGMSLSAAYRLSFPSAREWKPAAVHTEASDLAARPEVSLRIEQLITLAAQKLQADVMLVLSQYMLRLRADPRELSEVHVSPCRFCYGKAHMYQFTDGELHEARERHQSKSIERECDGKPPLPEFDPQGGGGYDARGVPNEECPSCAGAGRPRVVLKDTRYLSASALSIYGGAKAGKDGIEVKIRDKDAALLALARHVGFFSDNQAPETVATVDTDALDEIYERAKAKAAERDRVLIGRAERLGLGDKAEGAA